MIDWDAVFRVLDYETQNLKLPHKKVSSKELATMIAATGACLGMAQTEQYGVKDKDMHHVFHSDVLGMNTIEMIGNM